MEISILLIILLTMILLGGLFFQERVICLVDREQIYLCDSLSHRAVKFVMRELYLLNTVALVAIQKANQNTLIQTQNHKFEG
ncbi:hypothetical protein [Falsiporphyromonas endometrii]|uniref:Secreted protein n=1 Tax=Falsiporphyromonas endometrii TaxID=1387297 RepID=A0ABV9K8G9_9PORP